MALSPKIAIVGGGFFGARLALQAAKLGRSVTLIEKESELLQRASLNNQARVHHGYHYPRHFMTALRSKVNFQKFVGEYPDCIDSSFEKYYAVARFFSKTTARQFKNFYEALGAPLEVASPKISSLFNPDLIEAVFKVQEYAFDAQKLKIRIETELNNAGVRILKRTTAQKVTKIADGLSLQLRTGDQDQEIFASEVFNCTYSRINYLLSDSNLPLVPLKHELTEMCLIQMPEPLRNLGFTVMCGPFFSTMPYPSRGLHTLSHVRYTPHFHWSESQNHFKALENSVRPRTRFEEMIRDSSRYLPSLREAKYESSLWETKTILPMREADDGRPILYLKNHGVQGLHCVLGGKIDNVYDIEEKVLAQKETRP